MKNYFKYIFIIVFSTLIATSCQQTQEESYMKVEKTSIEFGKEPGNSLVGISTNQGEITALWEGENLGPITVFKDKVLISVNENSTTKDKKSSIKVSAGSEQRVISVTQTASSGSLHASVKKIDLTDPYSRKQIVKITSETNQWTANASPWIKVTSYPASKELHLTFEENTSPGVRLGMVTITSENASIVINVTQEKAGLFFMPYLDRMGVKGEGEMARREIIAFEKTRGANPLFEGVMYSYKNPNFVQIQYQYMGGDYTGAQLSPNNMLVLHSESFKNFIKSYGFELQYIEAQDTNHTYFNYRTGVTCRISYTAGEVVFFAEGKQVGQEQSKAMPTFPSLPSSLEPWNLTTPDEIIALEKANGGTPLGVQGYWTENPIDWDYFQVTDVLFKVEPNNNNLIYRGYVIKEDGSIYRTYSVYNNYELAFFPSMLGSQIQYKTTSEFFSLMHREGYMPSSFAYWGTLYYHHVKKSIVEAYVVVYDGVPCAVISYGKADLTPEGDTN